MADDAVDQGTSGDEPVREWDRTDETASGGGATPTSSDERQPSGSQPATQPDATDEDDTYDGLVGAFPYALRSSESLLFKSYVLVGGLAAALVAFLFGLALVVLLGNTVGTGGGTFSFVRAFFIFVGLLVVAPLLAPVLFVARRRRRGHADARFETTLAGLGYTFLLSLYVAAIISTPAGQQEATSGVLAPIVEALYSLPRLAGLIPPLVVAAAMVAVARRWR